MQIEAAAVAGVNGRVLRFVGVVDHAVLAVLNVGMDFHIVVRAEPFVQVDFIVGSPQDGAVQHAVVHKTVRQTADIHAAPLAVLVRSHLDFLVTLNQNLGAFQCEDALLALAKVHVVVGAVGQNKVVAVFIPVVLVVIQGEACFLLHAERRGQLQIASLILVTARFADTDQAATAMDKALDGSGNIGVLPDLAAGVGGVAITDVDKDVNAVQHLRVSLDVVKADKLHIKRRTGQRFDNARIAVILLLVQRMHPIDNMVAACNAKSDEEIGLKINDPSPDELGFLARTIDNMVNEIGLLAQRWSDDQRKMRELELQTLQYQINPHFLFNTLNTLKWIATLNHVTPVSHGIDALSSLLQSTLIKKDELIPFDDELRNLKNYCDIQQLRYAGRFEMEYQIEDAAGYWTVPRFILQPLVENSILHGTADEDDFVTITVRATVSENLLTIHISDTGCGFDPSAIKEKNSERFSGIGLSNVDERMRLHYGNEYGLTIESAPGIGTQCILCIPNEAIR